MTQRLSLVLAALPAFLLSLPASARTVQTHHAAARGRIVASRTVSHATRAGSTVSHASRATTASRRTVAVRTVVVRTPYGRRLVRTVAVVHHEPAAAMDSTRAAEIQTALIRAGYLSGQASGVWDSESITAMQKLQGDNGWQTKYTPDSRALVKLGLGSPGLPPTSPTGTSVATEQAPSTPAAQP